MRERFKESGVRATSAFSSGCDSPTSTVYVEGVAEVDDAFTRARVNKRF